MLMIIIIQGCPLHRQCDVVLMALVKAALPDGHDAPSVALGQPLQLQQPRSAQHLVCKVGMAADGQEDPVLDPAVLQHATHLLAVPPHRPVLRVTEIGHATAKLVPELLAIQP